MRFEFRQLPDCFVIGVRDCDFHYVNGVEGSVSQDRCRTRCKSLIQQNGDHATRSMLRLSSSTRSRITKNLAEIFRLEKGVLGYEVIAIDVGSQ